MKTLRVAGVPEHFNYPWHLAKRSAALAADGLAFDWRDFPGGTGAMVEALDQQEVDLALMLTEGAIAAAQRGSDFRLVQVYVRSPLTWGVHVAADGPMRSLQDKATLRVAISRFGSGSHLIAIVDALQRGQDPAQLEFVVVGGLDGARQALAADEADIFLWERYTTSPLVAAGEFRRITDCVVPWPAFVVALRTELIATRGAGVRQLLQHVSRQARALARRQGAVAEIAGAYGLDAEQTAQWFEDVRWSSASRCPRNAIVRCHDALQRAGIIDDQAADSAEFWHPLSETQS